MIRVLYFFIIVVATTSGCNIFMKSKNQYKESINICDYKNRIAFSYNKQWLELRFLRFIDCKDLKEIARVYKAVPENNITDTLIVIDFNKKVENKWIENLVLSDFSKQYTFEVGKLDSCFNFEFYNDYLNILTNSNSGKIIYGNILINKKD